MAWHDRKGADLLLRTGGALLLAGAAAIARHLFAHADADAPYEPLDYLLGLALVAGGSAGAALAGWGRHLFDEIDLSPR